MNRKQNLLIIGMLLLLLFSMFVFSCKKDNNSSSDITNMDELKVDPAFTFQTSKDLNISVVMLDNNDGPVPGMRVDIYTALPDSGGTRILSGITNSQGIFECDYKIAAYLTSLVVGTPAIGFVNMQSVEISNGQLHCILGGKQIRKSFKSSEYPLLKSSNSLYVPIGPYNSNGVPSYLEPTNDVIDAGMIQDINATLPEYSALPATHPQYFASSNEQNLVLLEACNVWVTFVHEGAGYKNVLGYYTYNSDNPPTSVSQIDTVHIVFPNTSFNGSGGGLAAGNKVYIGQFPTGTEIGWVLIADGFKNGVITNGNWVLYSDKQFNPETNAAIKQHTVLLNDIGRGKFLLAFEDIKRDAGSDNDFNDAIFYVTADPIQAIDVSNVPLPNYTQVDTDQDGIPDNFDDYPTDASKAFNNYYPSQNSFGSLAFEDMWPAKGDYDFNDMVVDYQFNQITNGVNKVVKIEGQCILRAMGAVFTNGFGIQIPVNSSKVASFTGSHLTGNDIELLPSGIEAGQAKATLILFNDGFKLLPAAAGSEFGVNTRIGDPYQSPYPFSLDVTFTTPVALNEIGVPPYNPFIFIKNVRAHEVHLINSPPTDKADLSLFGTYNDNSVPAEGRYYITQNNLPFGLNTVDKFEYPAESIPINDAFTKFIPWCTSAGSSYFDWFQNKPGYRNVTNIYH